MFLNAFIMSIGSLKQHCVTLSEPFLIEATEQNRLNVLIKIISWLGV